MPCSKTKLSAPVVTLRPWKRLSITVECEQPRRDEQAPPAGLLVISSGDGRARQAADPNDPFDLRKSPAAFFSEFSRRVQLRVVSEPPSAAQKATQSLLPCSAIHRSTSAGSRLAPEG